MSLLLLLGLQTAGAAQARGASWFAGATAAGGYTLNYNTTRDKGGRLGQYTSAGLELGLVINEHLSLLSGMGYGSYKYVIRFHKPAEVLDRQQQDFVELPLSLRVSTVLLQHHRTTCFVQLGFSLNICTTAAYELEYTSGLQPKDQGSNAADFRAAPARIAFAGGISQPLGRHFALNALLQFSSGLDDNIVSFPKTVQFEPGSLSAAALRLGVSYYF